MKTKYNWQEVGDLIRELRDIASSRGYVLEGRIWSSWGGDLLGMITKKDDEQNEGYIQCFEDIED